MTTSDPQQILDRIKARAAEATPGPWEAVSLPDAPGEPAHSEVEVGDHAIILPWLNGSGLDAVFIAHARTDVDRLTEALESVLEDHQPVPHGAWANGEDMYVCSSCPDPCDAHWSAIYPCPTVSTITNALTEEDA